MELFNVYSENKQDIDITNTIIMYMEKAEEFAYKNGDGKKQFVLENMRKHIINKYGVENYRRYRPVISMLIEAVISISKKDLMINLKKVKGFFPCCL